MSHFLTLCSKNSNYKLVEILKKKRNHNSKKETIFQIFTSISFQGHSRQSEVTKKQMTTERVALIHNKSTWEIPMKTNGFLKLQRTLISFTKEINKRRKVHIFKTVNLFSPPPKSWSSSRKCYPGQVEAFNSSEADKFARHVADGLGCCWCILTVQRTKFKNSGIICAINMLYK